MKTMQILSAIERFKAFQVLFAKSVPILRMIRVARVECAILRTLLWCVGFVTDSSGLQSVSSEQMESSTLLIVNAGDPLYEKRFTEQTKNQKVRKVLVLRFAGTMQARDRLLRCLHSRLTVVL